MKDKKYILITKDLHENLIEFLDEIQFDIAGSNDKEDYVDETFMDWNLPEMNDEDYNKLVDQVDNFLKGWEKEYKKSSKKKSTKEPKSNSKPKPQSKEKFVPPLNDIAEYMSLEEIKEYLLEDDELTDEERFDLYYEEHRRVQEEKNSMSYEELLKKSGVKPPIKN